MIEQLIGSLEFMKKRPSMFVGTTDARQVENYLFGLRMGLSLAGKIVPLEVRRQIEKQNGFKITNTSITTQMLLKESMSHSEIIEKMIDVEIECWRTLKTD